MNQILVTEKLYVTPELKKKKKMYKIIFILCIIAICLLFTYYIYAEYDRTATEQISRKILDNLSESVDETTVRESIIVVALDDENQNFQADEEQAPVVDEVTHTPVSSVVTTDDGNYETEAVLSYPKLNIEYGILSNTSEELLKVSLNKYWGPKPNDVGNYCIVGHNYKNGTMFGKLSNADIGDEVFLKDLSGREIKYIVNDKYVVNPTDTRCTSQITNGKKDLTLITCTNYGQQRLIVKAREAE